MTNTEKALKNASGFLQLLDNVKHTAFAPSKKNIKKLKGSFKNFPDGALDNAIDGKDVLEFYGADPKSKKTEIAGMALEMIGPETVLSGGSSIIAKMGVKSGLKGALKIAKLGSKISKMIDTPTSIEGQLKLIGKGADAIGLSKSSGVIKKAVNSFPSQVSEKLRRGQIKKITSKALPMTDADSYVKREKQLKDLSEFISNQRTSDGKKLQAFQHKKMGDLAREIKKESQLQSDLIIASNASDKISRSKVYADALKDVVPQGINRASDIRKKAEKKLNKLIVPEKQVYRKVNKPSYINTQTLPPLPTEMPNTPKLDVRGSKSTATQKRIQDAIDSGYDEDYAKALLGDPKKLEALDLVREGIPYADAIKSVDAKGTNELKKILKYEEKKISAQAKDSMNLHNYEEGRKLESEINKALKDKYERDVLKAKKLDKESPIMEDIETSLMSAKSEKDAMGSILSKRQRDSKPVSTIESARSALNKNIKESLEKNAGKDVAENYSRHQRNYGLASGMDAVAKKSYANTYDPIQGFYPTKAGMAQGVIDTAMEYSPVIVEMANKPFKNIAQEAVIEAGSSSEGETPRMRELIKNGVPRWQIIGTPEYYEYFRKRGEEPIHLRQGRKPQSVEMPEIDPVDIDSMNSIKVMPPEATERAIESLQPQLDNDVIDMKLPRDSERILQNPEALKAKVSNVMPQAIPYIDDMIKNDPEGIKKAVPKVAMLAPSIFERDEYDSIDGVVQNVPKFLQDLNKDDSLNSVEKAILAKRAYRGERLV